MNSSTVNTFMASQISINLENINISCKDSNISKSTVVRSPSGAIDSVSSAMVRNFGAESVVLRQGSNNANDASSLVKTADNALKVIDTNLERMQTIAKKSAKNNITNERRAELSVEYNDLAKEITRLSQSTSYNSINLLDGTLIGTHDGTTQTPTGALRVHVGGNDADQDYYDIEIADVSDTADNLSTTSVSSISGAEEALAVIEDAMSFITKERKSLEVTSEHLASMASSNNAQADILDAAALRISGHGTDDGTGDVTKVSIEFLFSQVSDEIISSPNFSDGVKNQLTLIQASLFTLANDDFSPEMPMQLTSKRT